MIEILVIFHSQAGHTRKMAEAVARGAASIKRVKVTLKRAQEATLDDLLKCDGLALGSPEYFGYMAGMIKDFFDRTYNQARGKKEIFKKPYVVFISAGNDGTGALHQIERICLGYQLKKVYEPVLAKGEIKDEVLAKCEELGQVLAAGCEAGIY
ncbi:MAG: NAD(P)H-dependent oxidoreductase [Deltaproteobacteria bacterium]|nr:NAD(P)H-dependent oxidoreductase [Deltaproteobacteria bacterium]MBW2085356.1 NAD(P)H-dependent oxidoreductase [Deltaproteobacteria bacterium]